MAASQIKYLDTAIFKYYVLKQGLPLEISL